MSDSSVHLSASARLVAGALAEAREVTVVELTALAAVSKSTVAKTLTLLERAGAACRTVQEADGIREADLWSPAPGLGRLLFSTAADGGYGNAESLRHGDVTAAGLRLDNSTTEPVGQSGSGPDVEIGDADMGPETIDAKASDDLPVLPECPQPAPEALVVDSHAASVGEKPAGGDEVAEPRQRLAPGGLAELVVAALTAHPDIDYTPTMLSNLLGGRSAGAIHNVLEKMHSAGTAVRVCDKPKRYRHAGA